MNITSTCLSTDPLTVGFFWYSLELYRAKSIPGSLPTRRATFRAFDEIRWSRTSRWMYVAYSIGLYGSRITITLADSLGGDLYWSTGMSLISDIPTKSHWPLKTHLFLNAGRLDTIDKCWSLLSVSFSFSCLNDSVQRAQSQRTSRAQCQNRRYPLELV